jgi:Ca2+-binding RTX toxin-like protein
MGAVAALVLALALSSPSQTASAQDLITCHGLAATIGGTSGDDEIDGTSHDDVIITLDGDDEIDGHGGDDTICAGNGDDEIDGGDDEDDISGEGGRDTVLYNDRKRAVSVTLAGNDDDDGEAGEHDTVRDDVEDVRGGSANDVLVGNSRGNRLYGDGGSDVLRGKGGRDKLFAEAGDDQLNGGRDRDRCDGGTGTDSAKSSCERLINIP